MPRLEDKNLEQRFRILKLTAPRNRVAGSGKMAAARDTPSVRHSHRFVKKRF